MTGWLLVRNVRRIVVVVIVLIVILLVIGDMTVPIVSLAVLAEIALPVSLVVPVVLPVMLAWSLGRGDERLEGIAVRPIRVIDTSLVGIVVGVFALAAGVLELLRLSEFGLEAARNAAGMTGLMLVGRWLLGSELASILPVGYVVVVGFFAGETMARAAWWAWLVRPGTDAFAFSLALTLLGIGCMLSVAGRREAPALR